MRTRTVLFVLLGVVGGILIGCIAASLVAMEVLEVERRWMEEETRGL